MVNVTHDGNDRRPVHQVFFSIACFFHEPLLGWLLGKYTAAVDPAAQYGDPGFGEKMEIALVKGAGVLMNIVKFIGKMGATFALPALDLILTPLLIDPNEDPVTFWSVVGASVAMTAIQSRLWARTREMGGIKETIAKSTKDKLMVYILGGLVLVDTYFDIRGYNKALYGDGGNWLNIIPNPTPNWFVTIGILFALCSFGELLGREVFTILGRKSRSYRLNKRGGGGGGFGGDDFGDDLGDLGGDFGGDLGDPDDDLKIN